MKAIILAAGFGTRLKPLTDKTPKALLPVKGHPLIFYPLKLLKKNGITEVVINLHHLGDQIEKTLGDGSSLGMKISYSWEEKILGTGGGIKKSASFFRDETFLVINSDIVIDLSLTELFSFHQQKRGDPHWGKATMVVTPRVRGSEYTWIEMQGDVLVRIATDKKGSEEPSTTFHFTGVQLLERSFLKLLPEGPSCIVRDGYQQGLKKGLPIFGYLYQGYWNDMGTTERLKAAEKSLTKETSLSYLE